MHPLLPVLLLATDLSGLSITIGSPQSELLVGEPLKLSVQWSATAHVNAVAVEDPDFLLHSIVLSVDDGSGARLYYESQHEMNERLLVRSALKPGEKRVVDLVFYQGGYADRPGAQPQAGFLFPKAAEYSLMAVYVHEGALSAVVSNRLRFKATEPVGPDRTILEHIRRDRRLLSADSSPESQTLVRGLLAKHPTSPYLRLAKLERFKQRANALHNRFDPDTGQPAFPLKGEELERFQADHYRRMAEDILDVVDWGPFEEEALTMAMGAANAGGDQARAAAARKMLFERHPNSVTVRQLKEIEAQEDEDEAPERVRRSWP